MLKLRKIARFIFTDFANQLRKNRWEIRQLADAHLKGGERCQLNDQ